MPDHADKASHAGEVYQTTSQQNSTSMRGNDGMYLRTASAPSSDQVASAELSEAKLAKKEFRDARIQNFLDDKEDRSKLYINCGGKGLQANL